MLMAAALEESDPYCLRPGEAAALLTGHPWRRFAVVGDSVAEGLGDPVPGYVNLPWADRVAAELRRAVPGLEYLNFGRRSLPAAQVRATQLPTAVAARPDLALVGCGNDALRRSYDGDAVDREVSAIITALQDAGTVVVTVSMLVCDVYPRMPVDKCESMRARLMEHADRTARLAEALGTVHVDLRDHPGRHEPGMLSVDGLHANGRAHGLCAAAVIRRLGAYLAARAAAAAQPIAAEPG